MRAQTSQRQRHRSALRSRLPSWTLAVCFLALSTAGCTKAPQKPPAAPMKQARKADDRLQQPEQQEQIDLERYHLAPPPAYGNKVVMAKGEHPVSTQF